jgi:hypothetical protein
VNQEVTGEPVTVFSIIIIKIQDKVWIINQLQLLINYWYCNCYFATIQSLFLGDSHFYYNKNSQGNNSWHKKLMITFQRYVGRL